MKQFTLTKALITCILLFLQLQGISQETLSHFSPEYFEKQQFAHRGGYANGPENTLETILFNIDNGVNAIEIDVQLTKDKELVLFHDDKIGRVLNTTQDIEMSNMSLEELKKIPLRDTSQGVQYVCSLEELIDTLVILIPNREINDFLLEVDFKPHGDNAETGVHALLEILDFHLAQFGDDLYNYFFISTFYPDILKELKSKDPKIVTAFAIHNSPDKQKLLAKLAVFMAPMFIRKNNASIIEPNICMINDRFVRKWHRKGILINTYSANRACEKKYIESYPIAYTTNCPNATCEPDASDQMGKQKKWCKNCK